jgi:MFS family permease
MDLSRHMERLRQGTFSSLCVRNYRLFYLGQIISTSGTFMQTMAQALLVLHLTGSGTALGLVTALQYVPVLVLGPWGGLMADRISKRKILFFTQTAAGLLALVLGVLVATGAVRVWMVDLLALGLGFVNIFDNPTRQTFHMELVGPENVRNAVTLYSVLINLARIVGPTLAGILIETTGLAPCFLINGLSYGAVVFMLALMRPGELFTTPPAPPRKGQIREGLRYVGRTPVLVYGLLMMAFIGTFTFEFQVSLPLLAHFTFHSSARGLAFLNAAMGVGAAVGGLLVATRKGNAPAKLILAAFLFGSTVLAAAFMPSLWLSALAMAAVGACSINFSSLGNSTLQLNSSPQMRGRVMSLWSVAFLGSTTFGGPAVGWFAETLGARWGLALGGFAALAAAALGFFTLRDLRPGEVEKDEALPAK